MFFHSINEVVAKASQLTAPRQIVVASGESDHTIEAILQAKEEGFADPWFVGPKNATKALVEKYGGDISENRYIDIPSENAADIGKEAIALVREGKAQAIMKGNINTSDLLRAALNKETGLNHSKVVTSFAFAEIPGYHKLVVFNDSGIIPYPSLDQKAEQIRLVTKTLRNMGYDEEINVAVLTPAENVNPKIPESVDAVQLKEMWANGEFPGCCVEGPISFDIAMDATAAAVKKYTSPVAGNADVLLFPNLASGNFTSKMLQLFGGGITIGMAIGAGAPIAMGSRAASVRAKYCSLAMAILSAEEG